MHHGGIRAATPKSRRLRLSVPHLAAALGIFAIEVLIARFVHDTLVRPFIGDVLVIVLLHCALRSLLALPAGWTALGVLLFACAIELGQAANLVGLLGLEHSQLARIVIGTAYDPRDFVAYALGSLLALLGERVARRSGAQLGS